MPRRALLRISRWQVHELAVQPDHVHLLLQIRPPENVSSVVNGLKGGTSRVPRQESPDLEEFLCSILFLWGESFWADGYL